MKVPLSKGEGNGATFSGEAEENNWKAEDWKAEDDGERREGARRSDDDDNASIIITGRNVSIDGGCDEGGKGG